MEQDYNKNPLLFYKFEVQAMNAQLVNLVNAADKAKDRTLN